MSRRLVLTLLLPFCLLVACTRERASEASATPVAEPTLVVLTDTVTSGNAEPLVTVNAPGQTAETGTPTPAVTLTPSTIDYYVKDGDTLSSVAADFGVDMETVRRLNYLIDDNIFVGQILQMPFREGMTPQGMPTATPEPYRYTIVAGDDLTSIALRFNVSTVAIMEASSLSDANSLYVGQQLVIPGVETAEEATTGTGSAGSQAAPQNNSGQSGDAVTHIVQPGETLTGIAQLYGVDANLIAQENNISNGNQLRVGQQLTIPGITAREAAEARGSTHIVQSGESLSSIAAQYGVTAQSIIELNGIADPNSIYVGQELVIPE